MLIQAHSKKQNNSINTKNHIKTFFFFNQYKYEVKNKKVENLINESDNE